MQELQFKNYLLSVLVFLIGVTSSTISSFLYTEAIEIPLPVYVLGILTGFLVLSFIFYSKANIGQTIQIAIVGILFNVLCLLAVYFINDFVMLSEISLKPDFILCLSPLIIGINFIFNFLTVTIFIKLEKEELDSSDNLDINKTKKLISLKDPDPEKVEVIKILENYQKHEVKAENSAKNPSTYEELYPGESKYIKPESAQQEEIYLEDLPENDLKQNVNGFEGKELNEEGFSVTNETVYSGNNDFIPTNIRLSESLSAKETDSKGRIAAIGKLLVDNRDIENVIDTNEKAEEKSLNGKTNVISSISGEKIYEKFSKMKMGSPYIKEIALIDKGGFVLANDFEDKQKAQIAGALISGIYHTLQNYIAQLSLDVPVKIFFESEKVNSFILKTQDEILFSKWDKGFKHIEYGALTDIFESEDVSEIDITPYTDLMAIENFAVSDLEGNILSFAGNNKNAQNFAVVSSAIFENLKVFLMNIQLVKLSKIVVFTNHNVLTISKNQGKIISMLTNIEDFPQISEELLKIEEIY